MAIVLDYLALIKHALRVGILYQVINVLKTNHGVHQVVQVAMYYNLAIVIALKPLQNFAQRIVTTFQEMIVESLKPHMLQVVPQAM